MVRGKNLNHPSYKKNLKIPFMIGPFGTWWLLLRGENPNIPKFMRKLFDDIALEGEPSAKKIQKYTEKLRNYVILCDDKWCYVIRIICPSRLYHFDKKMHPLCFHDLFAQKNYQLRRCRGEMIATWIPQTLNGLQSDQMVSEHLCIFLISPTQTSKQKPMAALECVTLMNSESGDWFCERKRGNISTLL